MRSAILLLAGLAAAAGAGFSATPLISYSSASGFIFGGLVGLQPEEPGGPTATAMATISTEGGQVAEVRAAGSPGNSGWKAGLLFERLVNRRFRGWGNGGDPDSSLTYDREQQRMAISREQFLSGALSVELGAEVLHSTVYAREPGDEWLEPPSDIYGSTWTAGPFARLRIATGPLPSLQTRTDLTVGLQSGGDRSYGSWSASTCAFAGLPLGLVLAGRAWMSESWNLGDTPFAMLPSLGPEQILRGYDSRRFYGPWRTVANVEIRRHLLTVAEEGETRSPTATLGMVVFADFGQVAEEFPGFRWDRIHPDAGAGLRFVNRGVTMAADFALLSPEGFKMALGFGESF